MPPVNLKTQAAEYAGNRGLSRLPKVLMIAAECTPLAKTGGLADVVGTLPRYLRKLGAETRVLMPYHRVIREKYADRTKVILEYEVSLGVGGTKPVTIRELILDKVCIWLVENEEYFSGPIYLPGRDGEQYGYFCRAALEALPRLDFDPDILHCHDWHTGMVPMLLRTQYAHTPLAKKKVLLTIHNLAYQGLCGFDFVQDWLGIEPGCFGFMERMGQASFLKAGCIMADRVNTVSPSYAQEICTPEYGEGLDAVLEFRGDVTGIVNGIDKNVWAPGKDKLIPVNYTRSKMLGKVQCKTALLEELGLDILPNRPLIGMVTRLAHQKGLDFVMEQMDALLSQRDFAFVLLGNGQAEFEVWFRGLEARWPGRVCSWIGYDDALSHRIYAGCDFFLMPSRFEPCGISQLISMAYGTLPIVRETGGLKDTVIPYNRYTGEGTGFAFSRLDSGDMAGAVNYALDAYADKKVMAGLIQNAMSQDFSSDKWAFEYAKLYVDMV